MMGHKKLYVAGQLSFHWQPMGVGIPIKSNEKGKAAVDSFFILLFSLLDHGYIQKSDILDRLDNHSKTVEVMKNGYKRDFTK